MNMRRRELQGLWWKVAYKGLNCAVAGAISQVMVAMIRKVESHVLESFPTENSYHKLWSIFEDTTLGFAIPPAMTRVYGVDVMFSPDTQEDRSFYAYEALHDFVVDYQVHRSGIPTKRMQAEIKG